MSSPLRGIEISEYSDFFEGMFRWSKLDWELFLRFGSPQSVILKQRRDAELKAAAEKLAADIVAADKTKRAEMVKRSEMYEKEYAHVICGWMKWVVVGVGSDCQEKRGPQ